MTIAAPPSELGPVVDEAGHHFIDELGQFYARFGVTLTFGRVFALLLLCDAPVSLDEIAAQLGVSKTGVSVATRDLERAGLAKRRGTRGSRRILYEATDTMEPMFEAQFTRIRQSVPIYQRADATLAPGRAKERMARMLDLHEFWLRESEGIMDRWRETGSGHRGSTS